MIFPKDSFRNIVSECHTVFVKIGSPILSHTPSLNFPEKSHMAWKGSINPYKFSVLIVGQRQTQHIPRSDATELEASSDLGLHCLPTEYSIKL